MAIFDTSCRCLFYVSANSTKFEEILFSDAFYILNILSGS